MSKADGGAVFFYEHDAQHQRLREPWYNAKNNAAADTTKHGSIGTTQTVVEPTLSTGAKLTSMAAIALSVNFDISVLTLCLTASIENPRNVLPSPVRLSR